jgi:hypothetical protein
MGVSADPSDHAGLIRPGFCKLHSSSPFLWDAQPLHPLHPQPQPHDPFLRSLTQLLIRTNTMAATTSRRTIDAKFSAIHEIISALFLISNC